MINNQDKTPVVIALTGASGSIYCISLLKHLRKLGEKTILIASDSGLTTAKLELGIDKELLMTMSDEYYNNDNMMASVASGSFITKGMVVCPCSVKSLSSIANSYNENLITRSADVTLKERRKLILLFRETPLHLGHIKLMEQATESGAIIMPATPFFYNNPKTIDNLIENSIVRMIDLLNIPNNIVKRWGK